MIEPTKIPPPIAEKYRAMSRQAELLRTVRSVQGTVITEAPSPFRRSRQCLWPIGEPGTRDFRYCDAPHNGPKDYCPEHHAMAYQRHDRRPDTAPPVDQGGYI
jgi:GcrA cell cycle regulator